MKNLDKPRLILWSHFETSFKSKSILPDSMRGKSSKVWVPIVEMSNSFQSSSNCTPKATPKALSVDFISTKSQILKWPSMLQLKDHRMGPTWLLERILWIDRCRWDPFPEYFVNSRIWLPLMGMNKIFSKSHNGCFMAMVCGLKA